MYIHGQNVAEAKNSLINKPMFATGAERVLIMNEIKSDFKELPQPLRFSKILSILLSRVSTPLEPYDLIAGRCVDRELSEEEEAIFQAFIKHPDYPKRGLFFSSGHCTYSWDAVVKYGLSGLKVLANNTFDNTDDPEKKVFCQALMEIYDALQAYILRYAKAAEDLNMTSLAKDLEFIAYNAPNTFARALQLLWIITLINCAYVSPNPTLTVGRLDMILYPLYKADIERGRLTKELAREYITDYYCKHNLIMGRGEHQVGDATNSTTFERIFCFDAPQYLLLSGTDENGCDITNELTELFVDCIVPEFKNPVVVVRYVPNTDKSHEKLWEIMCEKALASSSIMFYNDKNVSDTFMRIGIPENEARNYAHFGCNWPSPGDNCAWMSSSPSSFHLDKNMSPDEKKELNIPFMRMNCEGGWPEDFIAVMRELSEKDGSNVTIEDLYTLFFDRMRDFSKRKLKYLEHELLARKRHPCAAISFSDCFLIDSVKNGECFTAGAKYHFQLQSFYMFGTVVDCFITVDQLVFKEKRVTLKELLTATDNNFVGFEKILALCKNAEKYGMDTPLSNYHTKRVSKTASDIIIEESRPYFEKHRLFLTPCLQSDTWHLKCGEKFGATPNGRLAGMTFSQNSRPSNGSLTSGITGLFNSMLNIPSDGFLSGALNLDVDPKQFEGDAGRKLFSKLLAAYFNRGGLHAQVSCASVDDLIDAQKNPDAHRDLRVRVTGYSGIFVDICKRLQDDIINRFN